MRLFMENFMPACWRSKRTTLVTVGIALLQVSRAGGQSGVVPDSVAVEQRIGRVTAGLVVETPVHGIYTSAELLSRMKYYHTPGVSIAVVNNYRLEWARGFGVRDASTQLPVTAATRFEAGSVSKPVFAVVVMRLAERGAISLDQDVNDYLTSWKVPPVGEWRPHLTLRLLLGHGGGLNVHGFLGYERSEPLPTLAQVLDGLPPANSPPVRVNIVPGIQSRYSGGGITVAQVAVTDHVGKSLPELASDLVFRPGGMTRSAYEQPLRDTVDVSTGHYWMARPLTGKWHIYPELAAAGLWTTPSDLALLGASLQRAVRGDSGEVLEPASAREMLTPQHLKGDPIGISFFLPARGDSARFEHGGWDEGFLTQFVMYVRGGRGAVVMVNSTEGLDLMSEILRSIAREYSWPGYLDAPPIIRQVAPAIAKRFFGSYVMDDGSRAEVQEAGGGLRLKLQAAGDLMMSATSDTTFVVPGLNTQLIFKRAGKASWELALQQDGVSLTGKRLANKP